MPTRQELLDIDIVSLADGAKNPVSRHRGVLQNVVGYMGKNKQLTITNGDCIYLAGRTYSYVIADYDLTNLIVDGTGAAGGGVLLNNITPHSDMIDGQELMITFMNGGGLTYLTKNGVSSNIIFINRDIGASPVWGAGNFIAQSSSNQQGDIVADKAVGYEKNLLVLLKWSTTKTKWIELHRSGGNSY